MTHYQSFSSHMTIPGEAMSDVSKQTSIFHIFQTLCTTTGWWTLRRVNLKKNNDKINRIFPDHLIYFFLTQQIEDEGQQALWRIMFWATWKLLTNVTSQSVLSWILKSPPAVNLKNVGTGDAEPGLRQSRNTGSKANKLFSKETFNVSFTWNIN